LRLYTNYGHYGHILHNVHFGAGNGNLPKKMQEQIIPGSGAVDISDGGIPGAGVGADDDVRFRLFQ
jgi:hypothetical protein